MKKQYVTKRLIRDLNVFRFYKRFQNWIQIDKMPSNPIPTFGRVHAIKLVCSRPAFTYEITDFIKLH